MPEVPTRALASADTVGTFMAWMSGSCSSNMEVAGNTIEPGSIKQFGDLWWKNHPVFVFTIIAILFDGYCPLTKRNGYHHQRYSQVTRYVFMIFSAINLNKFRDFPSSTIYSYHNQHHFGFLNLRLHFPSQPCRNWNGHSSRYSSQYIETNECIIMVQFYNFHGIY